MPARSLFILTDRPEVGPCRSSFPDDLSCPPDLQVEVVKTVLAQAKLLCAEWV
ncbi:MAG: hypothetical protein H7A50_16885 [Akkermansiaceae bacterium]|nr:hypothetical protein [Akkermansiaceae bacterium]